MAELKIKFSVESDQAIAAAKKFGDEMDKAGKAAAKAAKDAADKLKETADALALVHGKSVELFQRGIGGGESAEKLKKIAEGFKLWGDEANNSSDRTLALVGSLGMIARMAGGILSTVAAMEAASAAVDAHRRAIDTLGASYAATNSATNGMVTAEAQLVTRQALVAQNIFLTSQQTATLNAAMRDYANTAGGTAADATTRFMAAVRSADTDALAQFGVRLDSTVPAANRMSNALEQLRRQSGGTAATLQTNAERVAQTTTTWGELSNAVLSFLGPSSIMTRSMDEQSRVQNAAVGRIREHVQALIIAQREQVSHNATLEAAKTAMRSVVATIQNEQNRALTDAKTLIRETTQAVIDYVTAMNRASSASSNLAFNADQGSEQMARRMMGLRQAVTNARVEREQNRSLAAAGRAEGMTTAELVARGVVQQSSGARTGPSASDLRMLMGGIGAATAGFGIGSGAMLRGAEVSNSTAQDEARNQNARLAVMRTAADAEALLLRNGIDMRREAGKQTEEILRQEMEARTEASKHTRELQRQEGSLQAQVSQRFAQHAELTETRAQGMAGLVDGAYSTMTGALKSHISAVIQGKEDVGTALKGILQETLLNIATEASVKALLMAATGIAEMATPGGQAAGAAHLASAAMFGAVALAAGAGYAGISALGSTAAAPAAAPAAHSTAASTGGSSGGGGNGGVTNVVVNVNGFAMSHEGVQDSVAGALDGYLGRNRSLRNLRRAA